jgi:hypothetical protein
VQSIKNGFRFIGASLSLALKKVKLQEPWFALGLGGLVILFFWFLPIGAVVRLIGLSPLGLILIGALALLALVDLLIWGDITSLLTCRTFATLDSEEPVETPSNLKFLISHTGAVVLLALTLPLLTLGRSLRGLFAKPDSATDEKNRWLEARTLALPIIAVEGTSFPATLDRLRQIVSENLLRFREDLIGVRLVAGLVETLLIVGGIVLGFVVGLKIADPASVGPWQRVLAAGIAMLIAWVPVIIGIMFSSFSRACYATALYQWVGNVADARGSDAPDKAQPPAILALALGTTSRNKKEK